MTCLVATFYKFTSFSDCEARKIAILQRGQQLRIKGTILLANEGINGTIAGTPSEVAEMLAFLRSDPQLQDLDVKESEAGFPPFKRFKVRIKREIVTFGQPEANPNEQVGVYVSAQQWNEILQDPEVIVVDTRNDYEVAIGSFKGAKNPKTRSFREFPDYVRHHLEPHRQQKVAMFCTGGIRCEKASSYLLNQGFKQVYHLQGGILKYLADIPPEDSLWQGECFVFDERVTVKEGLAIGRYELCGGCGYPLSPEDKELPQYQAGISCHHCQPYNV